MRHDIIRPFYLFSLLFYYSPIFRFSFGFSFSMAQRSFAVGYLLPLHICITRTKHHYIYLMARGD